MKITGVCISAILASVLIGCGQTQSASQSAQKFVQADIKISEFNAKAAWREFDQTFRLFYAYIERDDFDVEALLLRTEKLATSQKTAQDFRAVIRRMAYAFTDPHLIVGPLSNADYNVFPTSADMIITERGGEYVVADVRAGSPAFHSGVRPGWQLLTIGGEASEDIVRGMFDGLIENPTLAQRSYVATIAANGRRTGERNLTFSVAGKPKTLTLTSARDFAISLSKKPLLETERLGDVGVIWINNALGDNDLIPAFDIALEEMQTAKYLILDLRNTPSGGNTEVGRSIIGHFLTEPRAYQRHEIPSLEREFTVPRHFVEYAKPRAPYFDPKNTVVLGGKWTGSMGEGIVIGLDAAADMTVIASDMGDLLGGLSNRTLQASDMKLDLGTESLFHVDGTPRENFTADIPLATADTNEAGGDPAMATALEFFKRDKSQ